MTPFEKSFTIAEWPEAERPREKLLQSGVQALSNSELLAILLRTGIKGKSAVMLAREVLIQFKSLRDLGQADHMQWRKIKGLGPAKVAQVMAAFEIGRRMQEEARQPGCVPIASSADIASIVMPRMRDLKKEIVKIVFLDVKNCVTRIEDLEEGSVNHAKPIIREIFHKALEYYAVSIVCVHNHPSGDPKPSPPDRVFTKELCQAGKSLQIQVLDHIIIGDDCYYSFLDHGQLREE